MRLQDLYLHYNLQPIHIRRHMVDSMIRLRTKECIAIQESRRKPAAKKPTGSSTSGRTPAIKLTAEEEALCKMLGLSKAQLIALRRNHNATT